MLRMNIALNLYNIAVCFILLLYLWMNKNNSRAERSNLFFAGMCLFNIAMTLGDSMMWLFEGLSRPWYPIALIIGTVVYYGSSAPILLSFAGYLLACFPVDAKIHKLLWLGIAVLCSVQVLFSVLSCFNGMYFYFDADNIYWRGDWFLLSQLIAALIILMDVALIIICRKKIGRKDTIFISSYILFFVAAQTFQVFNYGVALTNVGVTISLLIIFTNIQSHRELRMEQQEHELTESRISVMLSQIQPHFLYNSLSAIHELCVEDPEAARAAVVEFSGYLRGNLDSLTIKQPITFERELRHVETYLSLEKKRFEDRLQIEYDIPVRNFMLPALTLQPVVENAVRHGVTKHPDGGLVTISTRETETAYVIAVTDDGVGFDADKKNVSDDTRSHVGIENVRSRLAAMCAGTLTIQSSPGIGTTATITIPKK